MQFTLNTQITLTSDIFPQNLAIPFVSNGAAIITGNFTGWITYQWFTGDNSPIPLSTVPINEAYIYLEVPPSTISNPNIEVGYWDQGSCGGSFTTFMRLKPGFQGLIPFAFSKLNTYIPGGPTDQPGTITTCAILAARPQSLLGTGQVLKFGIFKIS